MPAVITTWEQSAQFDPTNPFQRSRTYYTGMPGGYSTFYENKVPTTAVLNGLGASSVPAWIEPLVVASIGAVLGYFGMKRYGTQIKRKLGLSGPSRRRRR